MAMNISFHAIGQFFKLFGLKYLLPTLITGLVVFLLTYQRFLSAAPVIVEPVQACVVPRSVLLNDQERHHIADCLGWHDNFSLLCRGSYSPIEVTPLADKDEINIWAQQVSFYRQGRSKLSGKVEIRQTNRILNAQTAYIYRDDKSNQVTKIELLGQVEYREPGHLMIARKATFNPQDHSGQIEDVLYRLNLQTDAPPAWGRASLIERFANKDYLLKQTTYSTCPPQDKAWHIEAESIALDQSDATGVARHAKLLVGDTPILYTPYLSFPTSKARKSGFLFPTIGSSNVGGFDFSLPYYWNLAPNYDATIIPHVYSKRGMMVGGQFRFLTPTSLGMVNARILPQDQAYKHFLFNNRNQFPQLRDASSDRWSVQVHDLTNFNPNLQLRVNFQEVSDDYYLQDFSNNLAVLTERQLLRQGDLFYTTDNWLFRGSIQSYQTLQPINQTPVSDIYERLPQLAALGNYDQLPFNGRVSLLGEYDQFHWPSNDILPKPQGPRFYLNPLLTLPQIRPWGYITPAAELVQRFYTIQGVPALLNQRDLDSSIPRLYVDSGLYFDRSLTWLGYALTQTLEPRLFYLYVPWQNQQTLPVYDSAYMIFNADQLFRTNRFSGFDRIGDANQLAYAVTSRWIDQDSGLERALVTLGQMRYFRDRKVQLCQSFTGYCTDNAYTLGFLSSTADYSPFASRAVYQFNRAWGVTGDYVWDPATHKTNNGHVDFHYQPGINHLISLGYTYLVNGDITQIATSSLHNNPLHQITFAYSWPFTERWSTLAAYSYNISKGYQMMSFAGVQYDSCCWAVRVVGGRAFQSLSNQLRPQYNNNIYLQFLLKGLGTIGNNDPVSRIHTYLPGYVDAFHQLGTPRRN